MIRCLGVDGATSPLCDVDMLGVLLRLPRLGPAAGHLAWASFSFLPVTFRTDMDFFIIPRCLGVAGATSPRCDADKLGLLPTELRLVGGTGENLASDSSSLSLTK